jgi:hypothetical protein
MIAHGAIAFWIGIVVLVLGFLLLCHCPWMFAISAIAFGVSAAKSNGQILRWFAVAFIGVSMAIAIQQAITKERIQAKAATILQANATTGKKLRTSAMSAFVIPAQAGI